MPIPWKGRILNANHASSPHKTKRLQFTLFSCGILFQSWDIIQAAAKQDSIEKSASLQPTRALFAQATVEPEASMQLPAKKPVKATPSKAKKNSPASKPKRSPPPPPKPKVTPRPSPLPPVLPTPTPTLPDPSYENFQVPVGDVQTDWTMPPVDPQQSHTLPTHRIGGFFILDRLGPGFGLEYGKLLSDTWTLGTHLSLTQVKLKDKRSPEADQFIELNSNRVALFVDYLWSSWLYPRFGLSFTQSSGRFGWEGPGIVNEELAGDFRSHFLSLDLGIGSQWNLGSRVNLAVEWIGVGFPVQEQVSGTFSEELEDLTRILTGDAIADRIQKESAAQLLPSLLSLRLSLNF